MQSIRATKVAKAGAVQHMVREIRTILDDTCERAQVALDCDDHLTGAIICMEALDTLSGVLEFFDTEEHSQEE